MQVEEIAFLLIFMLPNILMAEQKTSELWFR